VRTIGIGGRMRLRNRVVEELGGGISEGVEMFYYNVAYLLLLFRLFTL